MHRHSIVLASLAGLFVAAASVHGQTPEVGKIFPVQEFPRLAADGSQSRSLHSIAEYRGKKVLLVQFASW